MAGVKAVAENIEVKVSAVGKRTDAEIAQAVLNALQWNPAVPHEKIKVKVENGWATLDGEAEWEFQRTAAKNAVESLAGVTGITNIIKIIPSAKAVDVKRRIMSAFHRSATIDASKIKLDVNGEKVTLLGKVRSFAEKRDAENAAWQAPGITKVENQLEIDPEVYASY